VKLMSHMVLFLVLAAGCASTQPASVSLQEEAGIKAPQVEPKARAAFNQAERLFKAKKFKNAMDSYRAIKMRYPGGAASQISSYRIGSLFYATGNYSQASAEFQSFLTAFPSSDLTFDVVYNLAASEYQQRRYDKALETLRTLSADNVRAQGPRRSEVVYQLGVDAAVAAGNRSAAVSYAASSLQLPIEDAKRGQAESVVAAQLAQISSPEELTLLLSKVSEPTTRSKITDRLAMLSAPVALPTVATGLAAAPAIAPLSGAPVTQLAAASSGDKTHIGVVLPLSGPNAQYGKRALDGVLLAAGVYNSSSSSDIELFIEDSNSTPAGASEAVERLVREHGVIAVLGPISWKESLAAGERAQAMGVLNLSLTGKEGLSQRGAYLFQNALTPRIQMENLVKHCIQEKRFKRFAILAPRNAFGDDMATEFAAVAKRLGGQVVGLETYDPEAKDFQDPVQRLAGVADPRYRRMESAKLDAFIKEQALKSKRPSKARLPPIVDFDAVFIPDGPRAVAQIAASLAYFDVTGVSLLGTTEWNSDLLYQRGGRLVEGALFPGGLSLNGSNANQKEFIRAFSEAYNGMPDLLSAQAFEGTLILARVAGASGGDRNSAVNEMIRLGRFESPLGALSFDTSRIAMRVLPIFTLAPGGSIVEQ
jgi:branched-chain amino acid transport system substrate-binding protein